MDQRMFRVMYETQNTFWLNVGMNRIMHTILDRYVIPRKDALILEVGCGTGNLFPMLSRYGHVFGIDQSIDAVTYARMRNIATVTQASIEELPFPTGMFDVVVCQDVLYHRLVDDDAALAECHRVLKGGGLFVMREPAYDWLRGAVDVVTWTRHRYTKGECIGKLRRYSFKIMKASYVNCILFPAALIARISERLFSRDQRPNAVVKVSAVFNCIFKRVLFVEAGLLRYLSFPFGLSVLCVAKKV